MGKKKETFEDFMNTEKYKVLVDKVMEHEALNEYLASIAVYKWWADSHNIKFKEQERKEFEREQKAMKVYTYDEWMKFYGGMKEFTDENKKPKLLINDDE